MSEKNEKQKQAANAVADALCSPPSHPTSLGDVWVGESKPSAAALVEILQMQARSQQSRDK